MNVSVNMDVNVNTIVNTEWNMKFNVCMTMTMTHSEKSVQQLSEAWPYRHERRVMTPRKKLCYN